MKVSELIEWLQTLEPEYEISIDDGTDEGEEISHIVVDDTVNRYKLQ